MYIANPNAKIIYDKRHILLADPDELDLTGCSDLIDKVGIEYMNWLVTNDQADYFYKLPIWYKEVRPQILERDKRECQLCKMQGKLTVVMKRAYVHHMAELKLFPAYALNFNNLVTLCYHCHEVTHERVFNINNIPTIDTFDNFDSAETW